MSGLGIIASACEPEWSPWVGLGIIVVTFVAGFGVWKRLDR